MRVLIGDALASLLPKVPVLCALTKQKTYLCYRKVSTPMWKMTVTTRAERFSLKDTGNLLLAPGHKENC